MDFQQLGNQVAEEKRQISENRKRLEKEKELKEKQEKERQEEERKKLNALDRIINKLETQK